jgi:4-hydroxyphenylpyruvate dioxygenase
MQLKYDYVEYYVGMAKMVTYWHVRAMGFELKAYRGPETGTPDKISYFLQKNDIKLVITAASAPSSHEVVSFVDLHGNGIKRIAIHVDNVEEFFTEALGNGAIPVNLPKTIADENGSVTEASIKVFDDNLITFVNYDNYEGTFMPGFVDVNEGGLTPDQDNKLEQIDHVACALRNNETILWEQYLNGIFDSETVLDFGKGSVSTNKSGLSLKILQSKNKLLNNVLVEPENKAGKSQVQVFIDENCGAGIQHLAFASSDVIETVRAMRMNGVEFTTYPDSYYDTLQEKYPDLDVEPLRKNGLLCDVIGDTILLQTFTTPIGDRPTFFYEVIQRVNNYEGFGLANISTLFEAVEKDLLVREEA